MAWAEGLAVVLHRLAEDLPERPLLLAGIGLATADEALREDHLRRLLTIVEDVVADGIDLRGAWWSTPSTPPTHRPPLDPGSSMPTVLLARRRPCSPRSPVAHPSRADAPVARSGSSGPRSVREVRLPDRIWVPALAALALALLFAAALLVRAEGGASLLVRAAPPWTSSESAPSSLTVQGAEDGFDGQFFYRVGAAPLSTAEREVGVELDLPALRSSRIGYSALAWVGSAGGNPSALPWTLLALNIVAAPWWAQPAAPSPAGSVATPAGACSSPSGPASPTRSRSTPRSSSPRRLRCGGWWRSAPGGGGRPSRSSPSQR